VTVIFKLTVQRLSKIFKKTSENGYTRKALLKDFLLTSWHLTFAKSLIK